MTAREKIEVTATILEVREKSVKITDGTTKAFTDRETGEVIDRPLWFFLPLSQIEIEGEDIDDIAAFVGRTLTLLVPVWLATEKGLI